MRLVDARSLTRFGALLATALALGACEGAPGYNTAPPAADSARTLLDSLRDVVRSEMVLAKFTRPAPVRPALVKLGEALAFDAILSGPKNISCMTCHQPAFATTDGRSLAIGQGGVGVGPSRVRAEGQQFNPRNAPALFNLVARRSLFHDGRVELLLNGTLRTPAGAQLTASMTRVFEFGPLSALPLFPVLDRGEMRGNVGNELAVIDDKDMQATWSALMLRLGRFAEYRAMFEAAYPGTPFDSMSFAHASNAIAGFFVERLTLANSPLQRFLAGDNAALTLAELEGAEEFLRRPCKNCHVGPLFSDELFHNTALPQIGPGKGLMPSPVEDYGRYYVTEATADQFKFRTASLLNVELTAPYGHAGQFAKLEDFVQHYDRARDKFHQYDVTQLETALRSTLRPNGGSLVGSVDVFIDEKAFSRTSGAQIVTFLRALTDPAARSLERIVPSRVPSGLPVDHP